MKNFRIFLLIPLLVLFIIIFDGCKKEDDNPAAPTFSLAGTWFLTKISIILPSGTLDLTPVQAGIQMTIFAKEEGTYQGTIIDQNGTTNQSGTWSATSSKLTFVLSDGIVQTMPYGIRGKVLTVRQNIDTELGPNTPANLEFTKQ